MILAVERESFDKKNFFLTIFYSRAVRLDNIKVFFLFTNWCTRELL